MTNFFFKKGGGVGGGEVGNKEPTNQQFGKYRETMFSGMILSDMKMALQKWEILRGEIEKNACWEMNSLTDTVYYFQVNPPYFIPLVEIVPGPWTAPDVLDKTRTIMEKVGQSPVTLKKEVPGFALNRIQYAIINECWNMLKVTPLVVIVGCFP